MGMDERQAWGCQVGGNHDRDDRGRRIGRMEPVAADRGGRPLDCAVRVFHDFLWFCRCIRKEDVSRRIGFIAGGRPTTRGVAAAPALYDYYLAGRNRTD